MSRKMNTVLAVVGFGCCAAVLAQYSDSFKLGGKTLYPVNAPTLREDTPIVRAVNSSSYLASVGGVAFDQVAKPADGIEVTSLSVNYDKTENDGSRLAFNLNGEAVKLPLYDWELIPIARFASSPYFACFTLFGRLNDPNKQNEVDLSFMQTKRAMNYHPALFNTLLGLRIFQLDELILSPDSTDLPTLNGEYILGAGESSPHPQSGLQALAALDEGLNDIINRTGAFQSYLICDHHRPVHFSVVNGEILMTGTPYYYFWKKAENGKLIFLKELSDWISGQTNLLESVNPAVWDSGVKIMQYSALFRYSRHKNPLAWNKFMLQIAKIVPEPRIKTPTFMIESEPPWNFELPK